MLEELASPICNSSFYEIIPAISPAISKRRAALELSALIGDLV